MSPAAAQYKLFTIFKKVLGRTRIERIYNVLYVNIRTKGLDVTQSNWFLVVHHLTLGFIFLSFQLRWET